MIITTSRKPSRRSRTLGRDLERVLSGKYVTRGKSSISTLVEKALSQGETRIILISDIHGNPGKIQAIRVFEDRWEWHPLIINLSGVSLQREVLVSQGVKIRKARLSSVHIVNKTSHDVIDYFDVANNPDSTNKMMVEDEAISFFMGSREIGPRIFVKGWYYADNN